MRSNRQLCRSQGSAAVKTVGYVNHAVIAVSWVEDRSINRIIGLPCNCGYGKWGTYRTGYYRKRVICNRNIEGVRKFISGFIYYQIGNSCIAHRERGSGGSPLRRNSNGKCAHVRSNSGNVVLKYGRHIVYDGLAIFARRNRNTGWFCFYPG